MPKRRPYMPEMASVANFRQSSNGSLPEWVPLPPAKQTEFYSGMKRGLLNSIILPTSANGYRPPVVSISLRRLGQTKGKRLIHLASLLGYLRMLQEQQSQKNLR